MPTAIVTGATGILGRAIISELAKDQQTWPTVHAISRSKKDDFPSNVVHDHADLTGSVEDLRKQLSHIEADVLFFAAYLQADSEQEMCDLNGTMLRNFLQAIPMRGSRGVQGGVRRVILVTGAKQYGVHFGPPKNPMEESDPWLQGEGRPPNFYYFQQEILISEARNGRWDWVVTYPNDVIGVAKGNFMNLATSIGLYCAITKEMGGELEWPGSETFYSYFDSFTYAPLHAQFCVWAATADTVSNQTFNVVDGDVQSWQTMWPRMAKHFGMTIPRDQFKRETPYSSSTDLSDNPPINDVARAMGIEGKVPKGKVEQRIDLVKWSQREDVQSAWKSLAEREGLDKDAFEKATWGFLGFVIGRNYNLVISMSKARAAGWHGYVDSWEAFAKTLSELEDEKVLPKRK